MLQKSQTKVQIKEEDLDTSNIVVATDAQDVLDAAFLGFVRISVVKDDPTVKMNWKVINDRDIDLKHRKNMTASFHVRKADWEHPVHMLVDGSKLDPACLSESPYPVKNLKPLEWTCEVGERVVDFLSGNHRRESAEEFERELIEELGTTEAKREARLSEQAQGGQMKMTADGQLIDDVDEQLKKKIAKLQVAIKQAGMWTGKVYDKRTCLARQA